MHNTKIGVFKIARTQPDWPAIVEWLKFIGVKDVEAVLNQFGVHTVEIPCSTPGGGTVVHVRPDNLIPVSTDATALIALAGKRCYNAFEVNKALNPNLTKIREDHKAYITNILTTGHGSILEHVTWSFAIENVSRVFTGEMNRHRAGCAISEGSMRYIRFNDIPWTIPASLTHGVRPPEEAEQVRQTLSTLVQAFSDAEQHYIDLCGIWNIEEMKDFSQKKKLTSMFRRIIGMGVSTGGVWTLNARALRHVIAMRATEAAEEEIYEVFNTIAGIMVKDEPLLFGDFHQDEKGFWAPRYSVVPYAPIHDAE